MKKKIVIAITILITLGIIGCSAKESVIKQGDMQKKEQVTKNESEFELQSEELYIASDENGVNVQYVAEVKNIGDQSLYFENTGNTIDLEDVSGQIMATKQYVYTRPSVIDPGESAYISEQLLYSSEDGKGVLQENIGKAILHIKGNACDPVPIPKCDLTEVSFSQSGGAIGRILNNESEELPMAHVIIPVRNTDDNKLRAILLGQVENIQTAETKGIEATDYSATAYDINQVKMDDYIVCGDRKMFGGTVIR